MVGAALTTILSYQAAIGLTNVCLGIKALGRARISDLCCSLLIQETSLLAIATAVFDTKKLRHLRYRSILHNCSKSENFTVDMPLTDPMLSRVLPKLIFLLLAIPIISVVSIVLVLEQDRDVTFGMAHFGGLALGMRKPERELATHMVNVGCVGFNTSFGPAVRNGARFTICTHAYLGNPVLSANNVCLTVIQDYSSFYYFQEAPTGNSFVMMIANIRTGGRVYRIPQLFSFDEFRAVSVADARLLHELCESPAAVPTAGSAHFQRNETARTASFIMSCPGLDSPKLQTFAEVTRSRNFVLVSAPVLRVADTTERARQVITESAFSDGSDLLLMTRRRALVSLEVLFIVTGGMLLLRVVVKQLTRNDLGVAVEILMKNALGMAWFAPMLRISKVVDFCPVN